MIGSEIAKIHKADIVHGDLTTSNMMVRHPTSPKGLQLVRTADVASYQHKHTHSVYMEILQVLIDFGLAYTSTLAEDKAVDLYVLERAFASTHPASEPLFKSILNAYAETMGKDWLPVSKRLNDGMHLHGVSMPC